MAPDWSYLVVRMNIPAAKLLALIYKGVVLNERELVLTSPEKDVQKILYPLKYHRLPKRKRVTNA